MKSLLKALMPVICLFTLTSQADEAPVKLTEDTKFYHFDQFLQLTKKNKHHYLNILINKANDLKLYENKKWHMLLHYKSNLFGGYTSEVDGEDFFMSESGKNDPQAELSATLASFFSDQPDPNTRLTPQCRFVARFYWLNQQLSFDPKKLPTLNCQKFSDFKKGVDADSITMIFPSAHPNGPASMFGHTSLKIDKKSQTEKTRMLDYTLNFAAMAGSDRGFLYAMQGLVGGFKGQYSILPYYSKIREYGQMESRDIWEYTLNLTQEQVDFIVMHAYELSPTYYDYYFLTENCSYHLLTLVESSMNSPLLSEEFSSSAWVIPIDTLKVIDKNNLLENVQYLPSLSTKIHYRRNQLSESENALVYNLLENGLEPYNTNLENLPVERRIIVLDLLYEYMRYRKIDDSNKLDTTITAEERSVLLARSKLHIPSEPLDIHKPEARPDQGHDTSRFTVENINPNTKPSFQRISWRASYHGLMDPSPGYIPNYHLEFLNLQFSNEEGPNKYQFDKFEILNIISLAPRDPLFRKISWKIKTGWDRITRMPDDTDTIYYLDAGIGLTYKKNWPKHSYLYGFVDVELDFGDNRYSKTIAGIGPTIGILSDINDIWKIQLQLRSVSLNDPIRTRINEIKIEQNIALSKNVSLNFTAKKIKNNINNVDNNEITFGLNIFH